ncbi:hypothetical protein GGR17_001773 [Confluentimicrobium naphthalenivorans]|jgi:hypothetical protein|uniref:Uncharacterized protein n=1 Tax=Actibacterium naphthalenivorans TaxID=1614693 RepID=A0A840C7N8_9RHOB|nr:hypothetical protein [Actibacterium naphthalenivorans]
MTVRKQKNFHENSSGPKNLREDFSQEATDV